MLRGKNVVVTGSNRGIGLAAVKACARHGANIWACMRTQNGDMEAECRGLEEQYGITIRCIYFDLQKEEELRDAVGQILSSRQPVGALINNAGVTGPNRLFPMTSMEEIREVFEVNFFAPLYFTQKLLRNMIRNREGSIVNMSSVAAFDGEPAQLEYVASKAAVAGATKKLASELGRYGIRVNALAPGMTQTEMIGNMQGELKERMLQNTALHRLGKPEEIAEVAAFLASDASSFITGQIIRVDGGVI